MRLAAGLCSDPLGELMRSPRHPSRNGGILLRGTEGRKGRREGTERGREFPAQSHVSRIITAPISFRDDCNGATIPVCDEQTD